jgi:hypothetical protein
MPVKTLPDQDVRRLLKQGLGPTEIARALAEVGIHVTPNAVTMWATRHHIAPRTRRYNSMIPWKVAPRHKHLWAAKMLRLEGRRRAGDVLSEAQLRMLDKWKINMAALCEGGAVIHYDPDLLLSGQTAPQGWHYVPRRPGIDTDLIRVPD